MTLQPGQMLAHYRLVEKIGEGGMGVVWKAEDTKLSRQVAVKVLPSEVAGDKQRLARFEREARILAALNHPNVAAIHGLESVDGVNFLVLELVGGQTLAQMTKAGPLPVEEALDICRQVAEGLEAAHEAGVIHRDLKPGNIIVTGEGKAKVLDFGLAKGIEGEAGVDSGSDLSMSPTVTFGGTQAGVVLGTAPYMSPEQARGKTLDRRTDIFSFGCVLYECLTGKLAFTGETVTDTLSAILQNDPDWNSLPEMTPRRTRDLLERCLEKNPRNRLHDISDARIVLERSLAAKEWTTEGFAAAGSTAPGARYSAATLLGVGVAALLAGVAVTLLAGGMIRPGSTKAPLRKFSWSSTVAEDFTPSRISPDGRRVAYVSGGRLFVRELDQLESREVATSPDAWPMDWSPDGQWIVLADSKELFKIRADGGGRTTVAQPGFIGPSAAGAVWRQDGIITFCTGDSGLLEVPAAGGEVTTRLEPGEGIEDFHHVRGLPDDRGFLYIVHTDEDINSIGLLSGGEARILLTKAGTEVSFPEYSPTGHVLFTAGYTNAGRGELWAIPFSLDRLEAIGAPFRVEGHGLSASVSEDGTLVYGLSRPAAESQLVRVDRQGREMELLGGPGTGLWDPSISPDGTRVAFSMEEEGNRDIWVLDIPAGTKQRLTFEPTMERSAAWSPKGDRIGFSSGGGFGRFDIFIKQADGTGEARKVAHGETPAFFPDGRGLVYSRYQGNLTLDIYTVELEEGGGTELFLDESTYDLAPEISPDGAYLAYTATITGPPEVYIRSFPGGEGKWQVSGPGGWNPRWNGKGDRLYFMQGKGRLMEVEVRFAPTVQVGTPRELFSWDTPVVPEFVLSAVFDVDPGGDSFVIVKETKPDAAWPAVVVVENWMAEFGGSE